jgi:hypothetical protein
MKRVFMLALGVAVLGSAATAMPVETVMVEQTVYRDDRVVAAPRMQFVSGTGAHLDADGEIVHLRTTTAPTSPKKAGTVTIRTILSILENGKWTDLDTVTFTGSPGSGATRTWRRSDGTTYRLVTDIRAAAPSAG